jgi:hypothetical protein
LAHVVGSARKPVDGLPQLAILDPTALALLAGLTLLLSLLTLLPLLALLTLLSLLSLLTALALLPLLALLTLLTSGQLFHLLLQLFGFAPQHFLLPALLRALLPIPLLLRKLLLTPG